MLIIRVGVICEVVIVLNVLFCCQDLMYLRIFGWSGFMVEFYVSYCLYV